MSATITTLWRVFGKYRLHVATLAALGFLSAIVEGIGINAVVPLISFFTGGGGVPTDFITEAIAGLFAFFDVPFSFRYLLGFVVVMFFLRAGFMVVFSFLRGWITADFLAHESAEVLRRVLRARWGFLLRQKLGNLQNTAVRDVQRTRDLLYMLVQFIQSGTGLLMYLLVAFNISPLTTGLTVLGGGALVLVIRPLLRRTNRTGEAMASTEKEVTHFLGEQIIGMKTLKASGEESRATHHGEGLLMKLRALAIRMAAVQSVSASLFQPFSVIFVVILFAITYQSPSFNIISFAATLYLIQKIFTYMDSAQSSLHGVFEMLPYAKNVLEYKEELEKQREPAGNGNEFLFKKEIRFEDVSLSYEGRGNVLEGVSFVLPRGTTMGVIGPSGAGKTSVADLLLRLFAPSAGRILVDGVPAEKISLTTWRRSISYVSQDVFLFNGTIADNIRFYRDLSDEEVAAAAKQANIYDFVRSLPAGFDTMVGDRGVLLSGGQRQRVALARALAGKPELLILDEATSALDQESERLIQASIGMLQGKVTVLIIAHRLSTIERADLIAVVEKGRITELGSPAQLRKNPESYFAKHT